MDRSAVTEWIAFSDMDLASAKHLCGMIPKPLTPLERSRYINGKILFYLPSPVV